MTTLIDVNISTEEGLEMIHYYRVVELVTIKKLLLISEI